MDLPTTALENIQMIFFCSLELLLTIPKKFINTLEVIRGICIALLMDAYEAQEFLKNPRMLIEDTDEDF